MPHPTTEVQHDKRADLFPLGQEVRLLDGRVVEVRPWSITTLVRVTQRIPKAMEAMQSLDPGQPPIALLGALEAEAVFLIAESLGWAREDVEKLPAEDVLSLLGVIWDVCMAGPLEKINGLASRFGSLLATPAGGGAADAQTPSPTTTETR